MISGFKPIIATMPKALILGSMPSVTSLEKQEYYGFKHNRFWKILALYFNETYATYEDKVKSIKEHHLALWDVIKTCEREGSLDSAIREETYNDIPSLLIRYPSIRTVLCNGQKSYGLMQKYFGDLDITIIALPSTSSANQSLRQEELYARWMQALDDALNQNEGDTRLLD